MTKTTEPTTVALVWDKDGALYDRCFTWETGQTYAASGYRVEAIADDGVTVADAQALYDYELALFRDCYAREWHFAS